MRTRTFPHERVSAGHGECRLLKYPDEHYLCALPASGQAATTEEITASIHEVAGLGEQTAKEAGDAAAVTEESSAALDEIARMVAFVDSTAVSAMEANRKFRAD